RRDDPHRRARGARERRPGAPDGDGAPRGRGLAARRHEDVRPGGAPRGARPRPGVHRRRGRRRLPRRPACVGRRARAPDDDQRRAAVRDDARGLAGVCAVEMGVVERALRMTAEYTSKREQFGKPIATFQAVGQRAADAYIDVEAIRWTTWQAVWRLAAGLPAADALAVAKFWAAEGGHRVVYAAQHLHGGIRLDLDYPVHRYYLWSKQIELTLGAATPQLVRLGASIAAAATR